MRRWPKSYRAGTEIRGAGGELVATICEEVFKDTLVCSEQVVMANGYHPAKHSVMHPAIAIFLEKP